MADDVRALVELRIDTGAPELRAEVERVSIVGAASACAGRFLLPPGGIDLATLERDLIGQALERYEQNRSRAARALGLTRQTLLYRMRKHGLR